MTQLFMIVQIRHKVNVNIYDCCFVILTKGHKSIEDAMNRKNAMTHPDNFVVMPYFE